MSVTFAKELHKQFGTDTGLEKRGFILNLGNGLKFTLARAGGSNDRFNSLVEKKARPHRSSIKAGNISKEVMEDIMSEAIAETVMLDWEGVKDAEQNDMPFTYENCLAFFKAFPDIRDTIQEEAMNASNYRALEVGDDVKN